MSVSEVQQIKKEVLSAINVLEKNLKRDFKQNLKQDLAQMEKRLDDKSKARFEALMAATALHKLEFVTRGEFEKLKKQVQRLRAN